MLRIALLVAALAGALCLIVATFSTIIEITVGTTSKIADRDTELSGWDRHSFALLLIAAFALVMTVGAWRGARPAMVALAVAGVVALLIALAGDLPDVHKTGVIGELYDNARANPKTGYYLETLGGVLLLRWRPRRPVALACALLLLDLPFLLGLGAGFGVVALVLASVAATVGLLAADTLWESALQENVDPAFISRISSYDWMGSVFFAPLGYLAVGAVAAAAGTSATVVAVTVLHGVIHLLLPLARPIRAVEREPGRASS